MTTAPAWAPTRAKLDQATDRTARAMADPGMSPADRARLAELEEQIHQAYLTQPGADAELQRDAERDWEAGS